MKELDAKERIQPKDGKKEYLTIEELKALMATDSYRPEVKQAFIFACFTGLRLSDMYKLLTARASTLTWKCRRLRSLSSSHSRKRQSVGYQKQRE